MAFNIKNYLFLSRFYDQYSGNICIPGPIYHDSHEVRAEVMSLLLSKGDREENWALELTRLSDLNSDSWEDWTDFVDNKYLLSDFENCVAPDWGGHEYSKVMVCLRRVASF